MYKIKSNANKCDENNETEWYNKYVSGYYSRMEC